LHFDESCIRCSSCAHTFEWKEGSPDFIVGGRFEDDFMPDRNSYEERSNAALVNQYLIPVLRDLTSTLKRRPRILSVGCGVGIDIDLLTAAGFYAVGIDCGNRCRAWSHREQKARLYRANGKHLPFDKNEFDVVYCGCVFPHVGVQGDSRDVRPDYQEERSGIAREMVRTTRPGGHVIASSPNRLFPLDIFHGRTPEHPLPYWNPPSSPFLLSPNDYRSMFRDAGCGRFSLLPVRNYWGFVNMNQSLKGRLLSVPVKAVFDVVSRPAFRSLRGSPISPWIVVMASKQ
jgi:SAM-dependent methyltransferase